nr:hypothetical protein GGBNIMDK_00081 [Bacillus cereus]
MFYLMVFQLENGQDIHFLAESVKNERSDSFLITRKGIDKALFICKKVKDIYD